MELCGEFISEWDKITKQNQFNLTSICFLGLFLCSAERTAWASNELG